MSFTPLDTFLVLIAMVPSTVGSWGIGSLLGARAFWSRTLIGLITVSGISAPFVFIYPNAVKPISIVLFAIGILIAIFRVKKSFPSFGHFINSLIPKKSWVGYSVAFALVMLFCFKFLPWFYIFENHDVMYFGWLQALYGFSDTAAVIVPTAWPLEMGSTHTLPGIFIATSGIFLPSLNLVQAIFIRAVLIISAFTAFTFGLLKFKLGKNLALFSALMTAAVIWGQDIGYELTISSYLYVLILLLIIDIAWRRNENPTTQLWLIIFLALAKAPIMLIALGTAVTFGIFFRKEISWKKIGIPIVILIANVLSTLSGPQSKATADTEFSLLGLNLHNLDFSSAVTQWVKSFAGIVGWNVDWVRTNALPSVFQGMALGISIFFYTLLIIYGSYALLRFLQNKLIPSSHFLNKQYLFLDTYMFLSLFSWVFIRNGVVPDIGHQAHAYLLASVVSFTLGVQLAQYTISNGGAVSLIAISTLIFSQTGTALNTRTFQQRLIQSRDTSVKLGEVTEPESQNGFYLHSPGENLAKSQVIASILGLKMKYEPDGNYEGHSQVNNFVKEVNR